MITGYSGIGITDIPGDYNLTDSVDNMAGILNEKVVVQFYKQLEAIKSQVTKLQFNDGSIRQPSYYILL